MFQNYFESLLQFQDSFESCITTKYLFSFSSQKSRDLAGYLKHWSFFSFDQNSHFSKIFFWHDEWSDTEFPCGGGRSVKDTLSLYFPILTNI